MDKKDNLIEKRLMMNHKYIKRFLAKYYKYRGIAKMRLIDRNIKLRYYVKNSLETYKVIEKDGEENILSNFLERICLHDTIYDIGANLGLYTLPCALKLQGTGRVVAFEPVKLWFNRLQENIALNSIKNVTAYNIGLYTGTEKKQFVVKNEDGSGMGSIMDRYGDKIPKNVRDRLTIQLVNGDNFIREKNLPLPNLIKIDVEGAELEVLKGLKNSISQPNCRMIVCEVHPELMAESPAKIETILNECGYELEMIQERRSEYHVLALKHS